MAQYVRDPDAPRVVEHEAEPVDRQRIVVTETDPDVGVSRAQQVVYLLAGILNGLLVIRLVLALFGANPANAFANFIYTITNPFVAPFRGLFGYQLAVGQARFEIETLVAIIVYSLIAFAIGRLIGLGRRHAETY